MLGFVTRQIPKAKVRKKVLLARLELLGYKQLLKGRSAVHAYLHVVHVIRCNRGCVPFEINKNFSISDLTRSQTLFFFLFENNGKKTYVHCGTARKRRRQIMLRLNVG